MSAKRSFNSKRDGFYRDLADAFEASESLYQFLASQRSFCEDQGRSRFAALYDEMIERMDEQGELAYILETIVPAGDVLSLLSVDAAESDKDRARILRALAHSIKRRRAMTKLLRATMFGPVIAMLVTLILPLMVSFQMVMFDEMVPHTQWGTFGQAFYWVCYVIRNYYIGIGIIIAFAIALFIRSFANWRGDFRSRLDRFLPYSIYRDIAAAGFLTAMAELMGNNLPLVASLEMLKERGTPWMRSRIQMTLDSLEDDPDNYAAAFQTSMLSPEIHMRLITYAERGDRHLKDGPGAENDAFASGLTQLGTDGLDHVIESVEKNAEWLGFASAVAVVLVLLVFHGGGTAVSRHVAAQMTVEANKDLNP